MLLLCALIVGGSAWGQSDKSSIYTSNVTLSATGGTKATASTIVINDANYSAMKLGSSGNSGSFKVTFPAGTKYIHLHAAGWNGKSNTLNLSAITNNSYSSPTLPISLKANTGISGSSSTYTFGSGTGDSNPNSSDHYIVITLSSALTAATDITISCSERCVIWGINSEEAAVAISSIAFSEPKTATVGVGGTTTLTPTILPANYTETVDWESDATGVATVSSTGVVTGVAGGTAHITAKSHGNPSTIYDVCTVTVTAPVAVTGVTLKSSTTLLLGGTETLEATVSPNDATNKNVTWSSADASKVSVDENGVITGVALTGETPVNITVTTEDGSYTDVCAVTVNPIPVTGVSLNKTSTSITVGKTETLTATVAPANATNQAVSWESDDTDVATVDNTGVVTAVAEGTTTITVTTEDGSKTATCEVTVTDPNTIKLVNTGELTFSSFANAGSYNTTSEESFAVAGNNGANYNVTKFECCLQSGKTNLQMRASKGYLILPTITSKKGFTITVYYEINSNASTKPTLELSSATVATGSGTGESTVSYTTSATSVTGLKLKAGNYATYITSIVITPTKDDRSLAFSTPTTTLTVNETVTNAATATPAGTVTYESSDETVATVNASGLVTALTIGTTTITARVAADADYKAAEASYELTVNGIPAATGVSLTVKDDSDNAINKDEIPVDGIGTFVASYTDATNGNVTVSYATSDATVIDIDEDTYEAKKGGTATITVTITPSDPTRYTVVEANFDVTVLNADKGTTTLTLYDAEIEETSGGSTLYGTPITLTADLADGYDGIVTYVTTNDAIADVAISGDEITITPKAVGTATITFTAPETANFDGEVNKTYALTVTAPAGRNSADVVEGSTVFYESFDGADATQGGGNDGVFNASSSTVISNKDEVLDNTGWDGTMYAAKNCVKLGSGGAVGSVTTPGFTLANGTQYILSFNAASWRNKSSVLTISTTSGTLSQTSFSLSDSEMTAYSVTLTGAGSEAKINFTSSNTDKAYFLDEVFVGTVRTAPSIPSVTIAASGYGTYCCEYPLDFTEQNENYRAWTVSAVNVETGTVTFTEITGKVKGGVPVILYGNPGTYDLTVAAESDNVPSTLLEGTLAPTYVVGTEANGTKNYGLSGGVFKQIADGTMKANKAYLAVPANAPARLTIVFDGDATGISSMQNDECFMHNEVYDLQGRRVAQPTKGLYIINGKKTVIK